jgi:hypothetical protein
MSAYQPTPPPSTPYAPAPAPGRTPVLSILSMVFGILGVLVGLFPFFGFIPGAAGVVLGFIGRRREPSARGLWLTGIITGFVAIAIALIWVLIFIVVGVAASRAGY